MRLTQVALIAALQQAACSGSAVDRCERDEDCPSGFCRADHTCEVSGVDGAPGDAAEPPDAPAGCAPDHDGVIARDEFPLVPGRMATYRVALDATVQTAPDAQDRWQFAGALPGDRDLELALLAPAGQWWEDAFPGATYATTLSAESDLIGVFELTADRLRLLGVVSPTGGAFRTELTYDPPVDILVFPFEQSDRWTSDATVSGVAQGVATVYTETYESLVDRRGTIDTPYGEFPVSRVAVDLTRQVGAVITTRRSFAFVAECYATVANVVSQDYEDGAEFTDAAEVRRLAP